MSKVNRALENEFNFNIEDNQDNFRNGLLLRVFNQESIFEPRMIATRNYEASVWPEVRKEIAQEEAQLSAAIHDKILENNPAYKSLYERYAHAMRRVVPLQEAHEQAPNSSALTNTAYFLKVFTPALTASIAEVKMYDIFRDYCKSNLPSVR